VAVVDSTKRNLWPDPATLDISPHQRDALSSAFRSRLSVLTGGPGTGKTRTFGRLVKAIAATHGTYRIGCASPFSKSAQVMSEYLRSEKIDVEATTLHRMLGVSRAGHDGKGWKFRHNQSNPLPYTHIFLDEWGTAGTDLATSMFSAIAPGTHVLCLGDINQIPPVDSGCPLRDYIAAGVPTGRLTEPWRNSGIGALCCKNISEGKPFIYCDPKDACEATGHNLIHRELHRPAQILQTLKNLIGSAASSGVDPIWDCQTLVSVNANSELGRQNVNTILQDLLNPSGKGVPGSPFRTGDKVICLKPMFFELVPKAKDDPKEEDLVANGEMGQVVLMDDDGKFMHVRLTSPARVMKVPLAKIKKKQPDKKGGDSGPNLDNEGGTGCDFALGYAITVHKSIGSQFPFVFNLIDESGGAAMIGCRELIYTGLSRFQRLTFTLGREATINKWCRKQALPNRKTFLRELVQEKIGATQ
jgi:exodeoxyribonuclease V alpha subunit